MTAPKKPEPTTVTLRVMNHTKLEVPLPTGVDRLAPGESVEVTIPVSRAAQYTASQHFTVTKIGDNADQLAAAAAERKSRISDARDRLAALSKTLDDRRTEERELAERLSSLEAEEQAAEGRDRAALMEAGRSQEKTATSVLAESGIRTDEITGLTFDLWGANLRRHEAEAVYNDALAVVAVDDARLHREKIAAADEAVKDAQAHAQLVRDEVVGLEDRESRAKREAAEARRQLARLEATGPERVAS